MRERRQEKRGSVWAGRVLPTWLACVAAIAIAIAIAGCGTSTGASGADGTASTADGTASTATTTPAAGRLAPIIYRPAGLSMSQKGPLLIALHGSFGDPRRMEGLTHFEKVASQHGFVVAYLASSDLSHPWAPATDLGYISSMIDQITASQNIDPTRVYVTGFSAGGAETWRAGCELSSKVAAIAVVSDAMSVKTLAACSLSKPVSELLIIGDKDTELFAGIPGKLPSAAQTTTNWRRLDGCTSQPPRSVPVAVVTQETWSSCTNGSSVGLYVIHGADHVWPPYGLGAPQNYPTSEEVWAFLSAHRAAPKALTSSEAKLLSVRVSLIGRNRTVMSKFRVDEMVTIDEKIGTAGNTVVRKTFTLHAGALAPLRLQLPRAAKAGSYQDVFAIRDSYGRKLSVTRTLHVPAIASSGSKRHH
jgi:polyhydroxybutyrate depolymerase